MSPEGLEPCVCPALAPPVQTETLGCPPCYTNAGHREKRQSSCSSGTILANELTEWLPRLFKEHFNYLKARGLEREGERDSASTKSLSRGSQQPVLGQPGLEARSFIRELPMGTGTRTGPSSAASPGAPAGSWMGVGQLGLELVPIWISALRQY